MPIAHVLIPLFLMMSATSDSKDSQAVSSPDQRLTARVHLDDEGRPRYTIQHDDQTVVGESRLGLVRDDADFTRDLTLVSVSDSEAVEDRYEILTAKRRNNFYRANRKVFRVETASGQSMEIVFQVSNDGVGFRYVFTDSDEAMHTLKDEVTSFRLPAASRAWLQPMSVAKTGWEQCHPSYEEFYEKDISVGTPSPLGAGWVYPALFRTGDTWLVISECGLSRTYCGTRLRHLSPDGEYQVGFPDPRERMFDGPVDPQSIHGSTVPRGWQRTYPHLMTMEAVKGLEFVTFEQVNAEQEPTHVAMLPFTRNLFDPMDFTPMVLDEILGPVTRTTTSGFELALSVLLTSGIQHFAEIPEGMATVPDYVRTFLRSVPAVWDDVRFVDGYPGQFVIMARRGGGHWFVAGINGESTDKKILVDLERLPVGERALGTLITDGEAGNRSFDQKRVTLDRSQVAVTVKPRGGFVLVLD